MTHSRFRVAACIVMMTMAAGSAARAEMPAITVQSAPAGEVTHLVFSPDGRMLITGSDRGIVGVWLVATGELIRAFSTGGDTVTALALLSDGATLARGHRSGGLSIWNIATGTVEPHRAFSGGRHE